MFLSIQIISVA